MINYKGIPNSLEDKIDYEINDFRNSLLSTIRESVKDREDFRNNLLDLVNKEKEPFLREIMDTYKDGSKLENKYNASDMLTLLEKFQDKFSLNKP